MIKLLALKVIPSGKVLFPVNPLVLFSRIKVRVVPAIYTFPALAVLGLHPSVVLVVAAFKWSLSMSWEKVI